MIDLAEKEARGQYWKSENYWAANESSWDESSWGIYVKIESKDSTVLLSILISWESRLIARLKNLREKADEDQS